VSESRGDDHRWQGAVAPAAPSLAISGTVPTVEVNLGARDKAQMGCRGGTHPTRRTIRSTAAEYAIDELGDALDEWEELAAVDIRKARPPARRRDPLSR
jgi:hypothetical protein